VIQFLSAYTLQRRGVIEYELGEHITALPGVRLPGTQAEAVTGLSSVCDQLSECVMRYEELKIQIQAHDNPKKPISQKKLQNIANSKLAALPTLSRAAMDEFATELRSTSVTHMEGLLQMIATPGMVQSAAIGELRRCLYYAVNLRIFHWTSEVLFAHMMKILASEFVRRGKAGQLAQDDVVYIATFVCVSDYYSRPLWESLEYALMHGTFSQLDKGMVKGMTTRLYRTKKKARPESVDLRRQLLKAMAQRVGELVNELELPQILRIIQCYTLHDIFPKPIFDLATRAMMNVHEYNAEESATLCQIFRKWRILTPEVCERLLEKICASELMTSTMMSHGLMACKSMFKKLTFGTAQTEIERQKLRQLGERLASRLDEVQFTTHTPILQVLDAIVVLRLYLPQKVIQAVFASAGTIIADENRVKRMTQEDARQLLALLEYFGVEYSRTLAVALRKMFKDSALDEELLI